MKTIDKITSAAILATALGMVAWSFFTGPGQGPLLAVAGILVVAAGIILLIGKGKEYASERGITLQTLIVTAVLVLMAGAAGVVIIAITNSAEDNLENQSTDIQSRCQPWEVHDPTLEAAGRGGGNGGIGSSAIGCVRVCYIGHRTAPGTAAAITDGDIGATAGAGALDLLISRSDIATDSPPSSGKTVLVVTGNDKLSAKNTKKEALEAVKLSALDIVPVGTTAATDNAYLPANMTIEVAPNGRYCRVWNDTNDEEIIRSKN